MNAVPKIETPRDAVQRIFAKELREGFKVAGCHRYNDADGEELFRAVRLKHPEQEKIMRPMHRAGFAYQISRPARPADGWPLYVPPYPQVETDPVFIVEGEACADVLAMRGLTATTSGGSSSADAADWKPLRNRTVTIWPDNDNPGLAYADAVAAKLRALGCKVRIVDIAALHLPEKGDCADWIAANPSATADTVRALATVAAREPQQVEQEADDDLPPLPAPTVTDAMYYGLTGEVMRAASNGTEVHPAAAGLAFLSYAAVALGRERFIQVGDTRHHARVYSVHVGRSAVAGKGMALALTRRIRRECERNTITDTVCGNFHDGGLSSREGLAWLIRDESDTKDKDGEPTDAGVTDKRLFVIEEELANVLKQSARDGNTLSSAIRSAWDGHDIAPATKTNRTRASRPHIGIHSCITPVELGDALDRNDLTNGFANRFLFCWAERQGIVPFPRATPDQEVSVFADRLRAAIDFAKTPGGIRVSESARELFADYYRKHRRGFGASMLVRGLIERFPPYAWRLALIFALLDLADNIAERHLTAAIAWLDYCRESTTMIFSTAGLENQASEVADLAQRIVATLGKAGGKMDREALRQALGKPKKSDLDAALDQLAGADVVEEQIAEKPGGGRALRTYFLKGSGRFGQYGRFGSTSSLEQTAEPPRFAQTLVPSQTAQTVQTAAEVFDL